MALAIFIPILLFLLLLSGFFSGSETSIYSIDKTERRSIQHSPSESKSLLAKVLKMQNHLLVTILFGNMVVNILIATLSDSMFNEHIESNAARIVIAISFSLFVVLIFGEILPKIIALILGKRMAKVVAFPLYYFSKMIYPIRWLFYKLTERIIRMFPGDSKQEVILSSDELKTLLDDSLASKVITPDEGYLIQNVMEFKELEVRHVMTPRTEIKAIPLDYSLDKVMYFFKHNNFSYIPVYNADIDKIAGVLHRNAVLPYRFNLKDNEFNVESLMNKAHFVPETKSLSEMLIEFKPAKINCAVVIDEYGGTAGMVTLNDILRKLLGKRFDVDEENQNRLINNVDKMGKNKFWVGGEAPLDEFARFTGREIVDPESETVAGYLLTKFEKIPSMNESIEIDGIQFVIRRVDENRIKHIEVTLLSDIPKKRSNNN